MGLGDDVVANVSPPTLPRASDFDDEDEHAFDA